MLAAVQGGVWLVLLSPGGLGFLFGPMGIAAAVVAHRAPLAAVTLLAIPTVWVTRTWLPVLTGPEATPGEWQIWAVLALPAIGAVVALLVHRFRRTTGTATP
jgi:hypothetical protein